MSFHRTIRTIIRLSAVLAVVALAKGCGDGESPSAPPPPEFARPTTVTVSPATTELTALGTTVQLSAEVRDQNDRVMAGATVTWTSSASSVATVDAAGLVRAVGNGTATITASAGSASGSAAVTVAVGVASAPDLVVGSPSVSNSSPDAGASFTLSATVRNQGDGSSAATTLRYYRSTDATITTGDTQVGTDAVSALSASGTSAESIGLTAPSSPGTYYYGACVNSVTGESDTSNNCSSAVTVAVGVPPPEPARPTTVTVSPATHELTVLGATVQLSAEVRDQNDRVMAGATVTWTSSASSVATVDAAGLVTAVGNGTATITASAGSASGSAAVTIAVGAPPPDLVVGSPSVSNSSPVTGASFTLSATVRNQGSGPSAATTLRYYRSTDARITTGDTEVGTDAVGALSASATNAESIDLTAPSSAGTYYYGACVDDVTDESDTSNNCSSAVTIAVGVPPAPDLVVGSPSVSNSSPLTGASFTLSATVRNQGSGPSAATTLRYYRSTDATITTGDTQVGTDAVGTLAASGTSDESIDLTAPSSAGTYYYGACVDDVTDESDTSNNCSSAVTIAVGVPPAPDLVVGLPSVSNSSPLTGASFTLSATVRNQGSGPSAATTLRYYRSTDATITGTDTQVGTDAVGALAASATSAESIDLTAPSSPGTYYYGACVNSVTGESDTSNNCSSAVTIAVGVPPAPDLVVGSPSVSNSSPLTGASFTLSATVRNQGSGPSAATTLRYYRSTDATITTGDTQVGTDAVGGLSASGTSDESIGLTAPASAGTYYYGACVIVVTDESDTSNNCSDAVTVTVGGRPDLVVESPSVDDDSPVTGASFTFSATVRNQGSGPSAATALRYYRSADATISSTDTQVGTDAVSALSASGTSDESIDLTAPSSAGTYYYGACVNSVTGESDTSNNCSSAVTIAVGVPPAPDLVVGSPSVSNSSPLTGASFTLSATVRNQGSGPSAATTLRYYRSTDATITGTDTQVGTDAVSALSASGTSDESIDLTAPSSPGTYYYGACVDDVTGESDTSNNCSSAVTIAVGVPPAPDLVVGLPSVSNSSPLTGASFTLSATVRNQGSGPSAATTLRYYRSTDARITTGDTQVGTDAVGALSASGTSDESIGLTAPASAGTYYYGACVIVVTDESDTSNNCSDAVTVTVGGRPDLVVESPSVDDDSPVTGASFTFSATVRNQGSGPSAATALRYYRSADATISSTDTQVGTDAVSALSASGTSDESIDLTAPSSAGTYYYGACVNSVTGESDTSNNCSSAVTIAVGVPPAPDLVVGSPSVSNSSPLTGASFTLSATVRNQGSGPSAATTLRYYRSTDARITTSDTQVGTDAVGALSASGTSDESISLTAPASAGTYYYGACVNSVTGESDTSNNCSDAVTVTVGSRSDLVVESPSVDDDSPETGGSFTLSATVSNDGDGGSAATTLRYYRSTDATITTGDTQVGTDAVGALAASATSAESIDLTAPSSPGTYYYGACVNSVTGESDTSNNCSSAVTIAVGVPPAPDLVVGLPSVSNSSPLTGASFTLSATVRNQGSGPSAATTLRYYRSTDARITTGDTQVGTDAVGALSASGTSDESISLTAPASAGTYYYGACVIVVTDESDTSNNCSDAVTVTVGGRPDLVVESPSVDDDSPETGGSFTLSATVSNNGDGGSAATTLRYYRSTNATISGTDTQVGTDAVGTLAASGTSDESIDLTAPSSPGTYYYGACVNSVTGESDTSNNCSSSVQVDVTEPPPPSTPDLVVGSPSVDDDSPETGGSFTLSATVSNDGDGGSAATTLRYYRSADATISGTDTEVGTDAVGSLAASGTSDESIGLTAPSSPGTYYYGACVDDVTGESDTSNNCSSSVQVDVTEPPPPSTPDLVVESPSVSNSSPETGGSFTLSATVRNQGSAPSAATTLRYYRSTDATISSTDTQVGTDAVGSLAASGTSDESIGLTAPASVGTYYYGACVDDVTGESDTSNNCSDAVTVTVGGRPDLVVESPSVSDSSPDAGASFTLSATVRNSGDGGSVATTLRYYRSPNSIISTSDTEVGWDAVGALAASGTSDESIALTAPASGGTYYYGACVDDVTGESDTSDNCSSAVTVTVTVVGPAPDLVVESPSVIGNSPIAGAYFRLSATVRNQGSGPSARFTTLRFYRSTDATISGTDTQVGTDVVGDLAASATSDQSIGSIAPSSPGTYYYGACVDAVTGESDTSNNCSSSVQVDVTEPPPPSTPDLVVGSPSVDDASPETGGSFTLFATVSNDGDGGSAATTLRYYRSTDATITTGDTEVGTDAVGALLSISQFSPESIDLTAPSSPGTYYYGACVDAVTGESDTSNNCSSAVTVTVGGPDLVVESPSVSDNSPIAGASFTLSATVRNRGSGPSAATILVYYRLITTYAQVGTDAVDALAASATSDESIDLTAPASGGTYYYGACVATVTGESDTSNNCSSSVQVDVTEPPPAPDLVVGSPSVDDDSPETGGSFTLSATVSNDGDGGSAATTLRYYRSTNATISGIDTQVGTDAVGALAASATSAESIDLTAPSQEGTYYYGACVDAVDGESTTNNNCSDGVEVEVSDGGGGREGECVLGATYASGESCDVYGTGSSSKLTFTVLSDGSARLGFITGGTGISMTSTLNGVKYHFVASKQDGGIWRIDEYIP